MSTIVNNLVVESSITVNGVDVTDNVINPEPAITPGTTNDYFRGDKTFQPLDKDSVGLGNVDNTSDADKPVSTDTQSALDLKVDKVIGKGLSSNDFSQEYVDSVDTIHQIINLAAMNGVVTGGELTATGGIGFSVSAGSGFVRNNLGDLVPVSWSTLTGSVPVAGDNFIYIDYQGQLVYRTLKTDIDNIFVGYITTNDDNTAVLGFNSNKFLYNRYLSSLNDFVEQGIGTLVGSGLELTAQAAPNSLKVLMTAGELWQDFNKFNINATTTFRKSYRDSSSAYYEDVSTPDYINNSYYNDISQAGASALVPLTSGYYKKDLFFISTRGNLYYQHGTSQHADLADALTAEPAVVNPASTNISIIAHVVVQEGNPAPLAIIDTRANFSRLWNGHYFKDFIQTVGHHQLRGLAHDDHTQYHTDARGDARYYTKTELDAGHFDTRYYTESEINSLLAGKTNVGHTHSTSDIINLTKNSVGLSDVQNVDQQDASNLTYGTVSNLRLTTNLTQVGNATFGEDDFVVKSGGVLTNKTPAQVRSLLSVDNVDNTSDANKPISTSTQAALDLKVDKITGKGLSTNDFTTTYKNDLDFSVYAATELGSSVNVSGGTVTLTGGVNFSISPGVGYTRDNTGKMVRVSWGTLTHTCENDGDNFVNIDYLGHVVITSSAAQGDLIALGYIRTAFSNTTVVGFSNTRLRGADHLFNLGELFRSTIGSLVQTGCNTAMQAAPNQLKLTVSSGLVWNLFNRFVINDTSTFTKLINTSDYGYIPETFTTANTVSTAYWNNSTQPAASALVPLTSGYYKKDLIALTPEGTVFYVYANSQWATLDDARTAPTPPVPETIWLSIVRSAAIISQEGSTDVTEVVDVRPMLSRLFDTGQAATTATVVSHSNLTDLGNDDHLQYLTSTRGDARYYRKAELDSGALDTRYYTESEVTTLLSGKSNTGHTHVAADITDLSKSSVGLSDVVNVDTTNASNISSGTLNPARLSENLTQLAGLTRTEGDLIAVVGGVWASQPVAGRRVVLGIDQVPNVDTTNASNISSGTLANSRLTANLKDIGGLTLSTGDFFQFNGTNVVNVTPAQTKTSLSLTKSDVGLGNVANVDTTNASNISSGTLANGRLSANLSQIGSLTLSTGDFLQYNGSTITNITPAALKVAISLTKSDVGLGNVANVDTTNASNISSGTLANGRLSANLSQIGGMAFSTNDIITYNGTTLTSISPTSYKALLSLTKTDVGLSNVVNSLQVINAGNGTSYASGTTASRPAAGTNGRLYASTDNGIFLDNGTSWVLQQAAITGDISISANSSTATLATVNSNIGTFNNVTVNAKGLVTAASNVSYLTGNQTITVSGDASGSGATGIALTLATVNSNVGTFGSTTAVPVITVNGKGLVTAVSTAALTSASVGLGNVSNNLQVINAGGAVSYALGTNASKPVAGTAGRQYYSTDQGITYYDNGTTWAAELPAYTGDVTSSLGGTALTLATVNSNVGTFNNLTVNGKGLVTSASNVSYLTGNQTITLSGDITGSGTTGITGTLATVNSNTGSFGSTSVVPIITVNGKGLITAVSTGTITPTSIGLGNVTNSLQVINAGTAVSLASGTNASKPAAGTAGRFYDSTDQGLIYFDNGTTWTAQVPAYTGDVTSTLGGSTLTLATVNSNIGTFNNVTVNAKGLVTAASNVSYLTGNQTITVTGDATGSGTTGIALTLASVNSNVGTFNNVTVNAKGLVTAASNVSYVADSGTNGIMVRTALNTTTSRSITGTTNQITVTNGNGVAGDPTVLIADNPVLPGTGSVTLPTGTSAQRDSAAVNGKLRWNTDLLQVEVSDTNVYRILGKVTQFITGNIAQTTGTTILPYDATLPQSTEGFQIWTQTITPTYTNSTIVVMFNIFTEVSTAINTMSVALFNGTTAIATNSGYTGITNTATNLSIIKSFTPGTTSTITLSARSGPSVASTMYVNRGNTETLSGAPNTSYIIMEII